MKSTAQRAIEVYEAHRDWYGRVPMCGADYVCPYCLGPRNEAYYECNSCSSLFRFGDAPASLRDAIVPMTTVLNKSRWYSAVLNYKLAQWQEYAPIVSALAYLWLTTHIMDLAEIVGGAPDIVTIVPSKRGTTYADSRLRRALTPLDDMLMQTLECTNPKAYRRGAYAPNMFTPAADVAGKRIVVVEDTWTTGATAVSACGALIDAGAAGVVLTPIARLINVGYFAPDHPYRQQLGGDYDIDAWPRRSS